jgi:hypothetical protein
LAYARCAMFVFCRIALMMLLAALLPAEALAAPPTEEERAYALVTAMVTSGQMVYAASVPVERCTPKGHRQCLAAAARKLASTATAAQRPVRKAVRMQDKSCSRRAGNLYLRSLRTMHLAALDLVHKRFRSAARRIRAEDRQATSAVNKAKACWLATIG